MPGENIITGQNLLAQSSPTTPRSIPTTTSNELNNDLPVARWIKDPRTPLIMIHEYVEEEVPSLTLEEREKLAEIKQKLAPEQNWSQYSALWGIWAVKMVLNWYFPGVSILFTQNLEDKILHILTSYRSEFEHADDIGSSSGAVVLGNISDTSVQVLTKIVNLALNSLGYPSFNNETIGAFVNGSVRYGVRGAFMANDMAGGGGVPRSVACLASKIGMSLPTNLPLTMKIAAWAIAIVGGIIIDRGYTMTIGKKVTEQIDKATEKLMSKLATESDITTEELDLYIQNEFEVIEKPQLSIEEEEELEAIARDFELLNDSEKNQ